MGFLAELPASPAVVYGLLLLLGIPPLADAGYTFEIHLVGYQNPTHYMNTQDSCCELDSCGLCDNAFRFCVRERGTGGGSCRGDHHDQCNMGRIETKEIDDNNDNLVFSVGGAVGSTLTNPLTVTGDLWPREVEICWSVHDLDSSSVIDSYSELVATLVIPVPPLTPGILTEVMDFDTPVTNIQMRFRLVCDDPDSVPDCSGPCLPTNDSTGHFTCDPDSGDRLCLEGYQDPWSRCTECLPAIGCSEENGYCAVPGECLCREGFTGDNCTECKPATNCSEVGGYCTVPGECLCREGFSGENCSVCDPSVTTCEPPNLSSSAVISTSLQYALSTSSQYTLSPSSLAVTSASLQAMTSESSQPVTLVALSQSVTSVSSQSPPSSSVVGSTVPSVAQPLFERSAILMVTVAGNGLVLAVVAAIVVVTVVVCARRRSRRRASSDVHFDTIGNKVKINSVKKDGGDAGNDHMYESLDLYSPLPTGRYDISDIGPMYAAVNTMYSMAQDAALDVEKNVAYDVVGAAGHRVNVSRNVAYAAVDRQRQQQSGSCRATPLPNPP